MSALSKHFLGIIKYQKCDDWMHPNETCTQRFFEMAVKHCFAFGQYYLPIFLIPLVLQIKCLNREEIKQVLIDYGKCIMIGNWLSTIALGGICWFRRLTGQFYQSISLRVPSLFGTLMFSFYPERIKRLQATGLLNMYIEAIIRNSQNWLVEYFRKSHVFGTLTFMTFSTIVMAGFKKTGVKLFWFSSMPTPIKDKNTSSTIMKPCVHDGLCTDYIMSEFSKSTRLALTLGALKFIVSNFKRIKLTKPTPAIRLFFKKLDYNMMAFTLSYNTLFKLLYCWFNNKTGTNTIENVMAAGFLSGITYSLYPIYMIYTYGLTTSLKMVWLIYSKYVAKHTNDLKCRKPSHNRFTKLSKRFIDFTNKIPINTIIMTGCIVELFQYRCIYPYATPYSITRIMSLATYGRSDRMSQNFINFLFGSQTFK